jgi:hypothetical protein
VLKAAVIYFASASKHLNVCQQYTVPHLQCIPSLVEWISGYVCLELMLFVTVRLRLNKQHGTCPACRHLFLDITPPTESDDESSDGGEWLPSSNEDESDIDIWSEISSEASELNEEVQDDSLDIEGHHTPNETNMETDQQ